MTDKNGVELKVGQVVKIEGGYFKADNGTFRIAHAPGNENWIGRDYSLRKVNEKTLEDSKTKYNLGFWPLFVTVNSREKRTEAKEHNAKYATIEVVGAVKMFKVKTTWDQWGRGELRIEYMTELELAEAKKDTKWNTQIEILEVLENEKSAELSHK